MSLLRRRALAVVVVLAVGSGAFVGGQAIAGSNTNSGQPADKMVALGSKRVVFTGQETIMRGIMHTAKPTDVMFHVSLECSLFTKLLTNNTDTSATANAHIEVWVEVDDQIVAIEQVSTPPQNPTAPGTAADKVTFCDRTYHRTVSDNENPLDGVDTTDDYIETKSSHSFNWVKMNMGSGDHKIEVVANVSTTTDGTNATAEAEIGNRTLIAEPTKMANDAIISETGQ